MSSSATSERRRGKQPVHSWAALPREVLRVILVHHLLLNDAGQHWSPWDVHDELWKSRDVFVTLKNAHAAQNVVFVCVAWYRALHEHEFWNLVCFALDPANMHAAAFAPAAGANNSRRAATASFSHYRRLFTHSCIPCKINNPLSAAAPLQPRRWVLTSTFGYVSCCREHRPIDFCGVCLRESSRLSPPHMPYESAVCESEDEESFPGLTATCSSCRHETLRRSFHQRDILKDLGSSFENADFDLKASLDAYVELGDGTVHGLAQLASDKIWLHQHTKMESILQQAMAATRYGRSGRRRAASESSEDSDGYTYDSYGDEMDDEDDDLLSFGEEANAKELALNDWARNRIVDGCWASPLDAFQQQPHVPTPRTRTSSAAVHPVPYMQSEAELLGRGAAHPAPALAAQRPPPTYALTQAAARAHAAQMRAILLPPLQNLARKAAAEASLDGRGPDACERVARTPARALLVALRNESTWWAGADWVAAAARYSASSSSDSASSSTSPVPSHSTLRTTPSPPPSDVKPTPVPAAPPREQRLYHPIPYVPATLPAHAEEVLERVWREAAGLTFACTCAICVRAAPPPAPIVVPSMPAPAPVRKRPSEEMSDGGAKRARTGPAPTPTLAPVTAWGGDASESEDERDLMQDVREYSFFGVD